MGLGRVALGAGGLPGDRVWAVLDGGAISGGKKIGGLMHCRARYLEAPPAAGSGPAQIELPDGTQVSTDASDASERISAAIGREAQGNMGVYATVERTGTVVIGDPVELA